MSEIEHPQISMAMATGYPTKAYSDYETQKEIEHVEDHPVEDMFGTDIIPGDGYFIDPEGRVIYANNIEDYLIETLNCVAFVAKK